MAAVLTGMVPWQLVNIGAPITHAFLDHNVGWASNIITCGALAGLTSVMLVMLIGQTRVLYAMASDGLLPKKFFAAIHPRFHTPWKNTILVGLLRRRRLGHAHRQDRQNGQHRHAAGLCNGLHVDRRAAHQVAGSAAAIPHAGDLLRRMAAGRSRPGVIANGYLMYSLGEANWVRLFVWLFIGLVVYFTYSVKHSKVQALTEAERGN